MLFLYQNCWFYFAIFWRFKVTVYRLHSSFQRIERHVSSVSKLSFSSGELHQKESWRAWRWINWRSCRGAILRSWTNLKWKPTKWVALPEDFMAPRAELCRTDTPHKCLSAKRRVCVEYAFPTTKWFKLNSHGWNPWREWLKIVGNPERVFKWNLCEIN